MPNFPNELTVAYSGIFMKQAAMGTALDQADIDVSLTATAKRWTPQFDRKVFYDCSDQYMRDERTLREWAEMEITVEATPQLAGGFAALLAGQDAVTGTDPLTHTENLISTRVLPVTTLRIGHNDGVDTGWLWKDVAVDSISWAASSGEDPTITMTIVLVGSGELTAASGTTWPDCYQDTPATLFDSAKELTIGGTDYIDTTHSVNVSVSNNIPRAAAFTGGSIYPQRWVRARRRDFSFTAQIEGIDGPDDALADLARANNSRGTDVATNTWVWGATGNSFACNIASGILRYGGTPQEYLSEALGEIAVLNMAVAPRKTSSSAAQPYQFVAVVPAADQAVAYLTT
jgi:hypothetical protein